MEELSAGETQRRITFLGFVLGVMGGLGLVMIAMSTYHRSPFVLISVLPLVITAIPVARAMKQLRDKQRALNSRVEGR